MAAKISFGEGGERKTTKKKHLSLKKRPITTNTTDHNDDKEDKIPPSSIPGVRGVMNLGNTCYLNSILQSLRYCPGIIQDIKKATYIKESIGQRLKELLLLMSNQQSITTAVNPYQLVHKLQAGHFEVGLQHDSQECLSILLDALSSNITQINGRKRKWSQSQLDLEEPNRKKPATSRTILDFFTTKLTNNSNNTITPNVTTGDSKEKEGTILSIESTTCSNNIVKDHFEGSLLLETKCLFCETKKVSKEVFTIMSVPVTEQEGSRECGAFSLFWSISRFASIQYLSSHNKYFCQVCRRLTEARHSIIIDKLPPTIIIHYKRFSTKYDNSGVVKATGNIATPHVLSFSQWCSPSCPNKSSLYKLYSIILHSGSTCNSGHYTCLVRRSFCDEEREGERGEGGRGEGEGKGEKREGEGGRGEGEGKEEGEGAQERGTKEEREKEKRTEERSTTTHSNNWLHFDDDLVSEVSDNYVNYLLSPMSSCCNDTPYIVFYTLDC